MRLTTGNALKSRAGLSDGAGQVVELNETVGSGLDCRGGGRLGAGWCQFSAEARFDGGRWHRSWCGGEAFAWGGENLDVDFWNARLGHTFDAGEKIGHGCDHRCFLVWSDFAGEIPLVEAFGNGLSAFAFQVFADVKLDGFEDAFVGVAGHLERESLLHLLWYNTKRRLWNGELRKAGNRKSRERGEKLFGC